MVALEFGLFGLFGLVLGSFLNVCIDRLPRGESVAEGRSHCDSCGRVLSAGELIPVLSYLALRGRCRTCRAPIPPRIPLVELGTGLLFGLIGFRYSASLEAALVAAYVSLLIVILVIDLEQGRILNKLSYPAISLALLAVPFTPGRNADQLLIGGAAAFGLLLLIAWIYPAGMGLGDVKLAAFIGLTVGYPQVWLALFLAFVGGGLISGALVLARVIGRKDPIAFGPFLAAGAIATLLYGDSILTWWSHGI